MSKYTNRVTDLTKKLLGEAEDKTEYQKFFDSALEKFGVDSPEELDPDKKDDFFNYVDANWDAGEGETDPDEDEPGDEPLPEGVMPDQTASQDLDGDLDPDDELYDVLDLDYDSATHEDPLVSSAEDALGVAPEAEFNLEETKAEPVDPSLARIKKVDEAQKIDMSQVYMIVKNPKDKSQQFWIVNRDGKGAAPQDKVKMYIVDPKGNVIDDMGTHQNLKGALKFAKSRGFTQTSSMVGSKMQNEAGLDPDSVTGVKGKFDRKMLKRLKDEYSKIRRIDPSSEPYQRLIKWLDKLDDKQLQQIEQADIKWLSSLARNRLPMEKIKQVESEEDVLRQEIRSILRDMM